MVLAYFNPVLNPDPANMATPIDITTMAVLHAAVATEYFCHSIVRFLSKSSKECSTRTVLMSDIAKAAKNVQQEQYL